MGIRQILAEQTRKKLRFVVLRPVNQSEVKPFLDSLPQRIANGLPSEEFDLEINTRLGPTFIYVGCLKPKSRMLFDFDGTALNDQLRPGDVLDEIEEFRKRCEDGTYRRAEKGSQITIQELPTP